MSFTYADGADSRTPQSRPFRDRRGRGARGPGVLTRSPGTPVLRTASDRFDAIALAIISEIDARWSEHLGLIEYAVEDIPDVPAHWDLTRVPLSAAMPRMGAHPARLILFRRPIEHRCDSRSDLVAMITKLVIEQVADLLNVEPHVVDDRYREEL